MADAPAPSIVVLLVATNGATWLPDVLRGLRRQTHRPLEVLAVDNASDDLSREMLERAFGSRRVVALERRVGYGRALAAALTAIVDRRIEADAFLILHDDTALAPDAIDAMAAVLSAERVGIVGAKLVEWDDVGLLQDVGGSIDRYGRLFPLVEKGELDEGQHDAPHEVLAVSSAAMLVTREVVERTGLFDSRYVVLRDDLDLCWRARIAGYRVVATGAATARHALAGYRQLRDSPTKSRVRYFGDRNALATLIKNYGIPRLALFLPAALGLSLASALVFALSGKERAARQALEALEWNVVHLPSTLRQRARTQASRTVPDAEITRFMARGGSRFRAYLERALERVVPPIEVEEGTSPAPRAGFRAWARAHPAVLFALAFGIVYAVGARSILGSGTLAGADMPRYPDRLGDLFSEFFSGWRSAGSGGAAPATPGLVLLGILRFVCLGSAWLAQRVLILGLPLLAGATARRLAGVAGLKGRGRHAATLAYALSPLALGALGAGHLADLVLVASAPGLLVPIFRAAGFGPAPDWRSAAAGTAGLAAAASLAPWSLVFVAGAGVLLGLSVALSGNARDGRAAAARGGLICAGAALMLLPWTVELFRPGSPLGLGGSGLPAKMADLVGLRAGAVPVVPRVFAFGLPVAALAGVVLAGEARRQTARIFATAATASVLLAWAVARGVPWIAPRPAEPLVLAAAFTALLVGIGIEGVRERLAARTFGGPHLVVGTVTFLLGLELAASILWIAGGSRPGIRESSVLLPAFLSEEARTQGAFRVLWVSGDPRNIHVALTGPEGDTLRQYGARPAGAGDAALRRATAALVSGSESGARMLATFGVRYVIVRPEGGDSLAEALEREGDLRFAQRFRGAHVYRNQAAIPVGASISAPGWVAASAGDLSAVAAAEPSAAAGPGLTQPAPTALAGQTGKGAKLLVLAVDFNGRWQARVAGKAVAPRRSFGWATAFAIPAEGEVRIRWRGQIPHRLALALQLLILAAFAVEWSGRAARDRGER